MTKTLEVLFTPAEFALLPQRDLRATVCVVFDVLRATSSMVTVLTNGAAGILPVAEIPEALDLRLTDPQILLAGEREGLRIEADLTGGVAFDLGNSPREFTPERVRGRRIVMTTTNGTRALRACAGAGTVLVASFLNLGATELFLRERAPAELLVVCSGTFEAAALEDVLGAGALCDLLWSNYSTGSAADSAGMARGLFQMVARDLSGAIGASRNGRRLAARPELRDDVAFCARRDVSNLVAEMGKDGWVRARG